MADQTRRSYPVPSLWLPYRLTSYAIILGVSAGLGTWLSSLAEFPPLLMLIAGMAWGLVAFPAARALEAPVLGWVARRRVAGPAARRGGWAFRLDVDGQVLTYPTGDAPDPLCAWARAHDLDPHCVVVPQTATVRDGWLTLEMYRVDAAGNKYVDPADHTRAARETVTVRLMDNPPDCWVRREAGRGTA